MNRRSLLFTLLIILLVFALFSFLGPVSWGPYPGSIAAIVVVIIIVALLFG